MYRVTWTSGADQSLQNYYLDVKGSSVLSLSMLSQLQLFELAAISESIRAIDRLLSVNPLVIGQEASVAGFRKLTIGPMTVGYRANAEKRMVQVCVLHYFRRRN